MLMFVMKIFEFCYVIMKNKTITQIVILIRLIPGRKEIKYRVHQFAMISLVHFIFGLSP